MPTSGERRAASGHSKSRGARGSFIVAADLRAIGSFIPPSRLPATNKIPEKKMLGIKSENGGQRLAQTRGASAREVRARGISAPAAPWAGTSWGQRDDALALALALRLDNARRRKQGAANNSALLRAQN